MTRGSPTGVTLLASFDNRNGFRPWFAHDNRKSGGVTIVCGHWSTLDLELAPNVLMLDSGCLWGGTLTAMRLDDRRVFQVPSRQPVALT